MATPYPFPIDPVLSGVVIAYKNEEYIADRVLPRLDPKLTKRDFRYSVFAFGQTVTVPDTRVGRKGQPNEVEFASTETPASVEDYGLDDLVPIDDINNAQANYDPKAHAAMGVADLVALDREQRVAGIVFNSATYPTANKTTLSGSSQWSDPTANPIDAVQNAADSMIMRPNKLVIGHQAWSSMRRNPNILKAISFSGTDKGLANLSAVAELLELDEIIVGRTWGNTAKRGQAPSLSRLWGKHAALIRQDALGSTMLSGRPTFGFTAQYGERIAGDIPEPKVGLRGAIRVRVGESVKEVVGAADLGFFFQNVVA